jgi:hypothetical protein
MNGKSNGGLLAHAEEGAAWGDSSSLDRVSSHHGLQPLNLEPSSAPVPGRYGLRASLCRLAHPAFSCLERAPLCCATVELADRRLPAGLHRLNSLPAVVAVA